MAPISEGIVKAGKARVAKKRKTEAEEVTEVMARRNKAVILIDLYVDSFKMQLKPTVLFPKHKK